MCEHHNLNEDKKLPEAFIEGSRPSLKKYEKVIAVIQEKTICYLYC
jgi:hypothetical protein